MRLIKEGWCHLPAPGPEVTDRSSEVTNRSWLKHSHNIAAKGIWFNPPENGKGGGTALYVNSPINLYDSLLTSYTTRDCPPAWPNTVPHPYFCKDTAHETSHVWVFKKFLMFQWDSILKVQVWIFWLFVWVPDEAQHKQENHKAWRNAESLLQISVYHHITVNLMKSVKALHNPLTQTNNFHVTKWACVVCNSVHLTLFKCLSSNSTCKKHWYMICWVGCLQVNVG